MSDTLEELVIQRANRLPAPAGPAGNGATAARQFDAVLMSAGFKLSRDLLAHLSSLAAGTVIDTAVRVLPVVRRMVGDHVRHNTYFRDFPANVPDTVDFWVDCLLDAAGAGLEAAGIAETAIAEDALNLLTLPKYGRYQHTYEEMLAAHDDLVEAAGDRVTVLHLGDELQEEVHRIYLSLAASRVPLGEEDRVVLAELAAYCADGPQPDVVPVRENRALINHVRIGRGDALLADTVTDVLRVACALSGGDVSLQEPTRFRTLLRTYRRALLSTLDRVIEASPAKLGDVGAHAEAWKRLGERLHPHEYPQWPRAAEVFAVARGDLSAPSLQGRVDAAFAAGDVEAAAGLLRNAPGLLFRSVDRLLRAAGPDGTEVVLDAVASAAGGASCRVLLSVREHLQNRRAAGPGRRRVFANRKGRAWVAEDERPLPPADAVHRLLDLIDAEVRRRLPAVDHLVVDPSMLEVTLPLTGTATGTGFGMLPRGSVCKVDGGLLRFFVYWKERARTTDFDLSALLLDDDYGDAEWLSWTNLSSVAGAHSGDITAAPQGASEFIDLDLAKVRSRFIVPQVHIYGGEGFEEVEESFFGFMSRDAEQAGRPFEARTVRTKSELRGPGRVALPLAFHRRGDAWFATWMHLHLAGSPRFNQVEDHHVSATLLMRGIVERDHLGIAYLADLWAATGTEVTLWDGGPLPDGPVTFIGMERPEGLVDGSQVFAPGNLGDLIPD